MDNHLTNSQSRTSLDNRYDILALVMKLPESERAGALEAFIEDELTILRNSRPPLDRSGPLDAARRNLNAIQRPPRQFGLIEFGVFSAPVTNISTELNELNDVRQRLDRDSIDM